MGPAIEIAVGRMPTLAELKALAPALAEAARRVHGEWEQDADGMDVELGAGGICQDVASAMAGVLGEGGFEQVLQVHAGCGENHVFLVALLEDGVYEVDIPPSVYETGSGYVWRKREDARFDADCVAVSRIAGPMDAEAFEATYCD